MHFSCIPVKRTRRRTAKLNHAETLYGGCNNGFEKTSSLYEENDTVIVSVENDTLNIHVGVNYICCATFEGKSEYEGDTLQITVSDVCTDDDMCYCHCMCYYTFDFRYTGLEAGDYPCKVRLWDAMEEKIYCFVCRHDHDPELIKPFAASCRALH